MEAIGEEIINKISGRELVCNWIQSEPDCGITRHCELLREDDTWENRLAHSARKEVYFKEIKTHMNNFDFSKTTKSVPWKIDIVMGLGGLPSSSGEILIFSKFHQ